MVDEPLNPGDGVIPERTCDDGCMNEFWRKLTSDGFVNDSPAPPLVIVIGVLLDGGALFMKLACIR